MFAWSDVIQEYITRRSNLLFRIFKAGRRIHTQRAVKHSKVNHLLQDLKQPSLLCSLISTIWTTVSFIVRWYYFLRQTTWRDGFSSYQKSPLVTVKYHDISLRKHSKFFCTKVTVYSENIKLLHAMTFFKTNSVYSWWVWYRQRSTCSTTRHFMSLIMNSSFDVAVNREKRGHLCWISMRSVRLEMRCGFMATCIATSLLTAHLISLVTSFSSTKSIALFSIHF